MNSTYSICHIIDFRACWLYFLSIPFFVIYVSCITWTTVYSLRTLLVLRPSRRLTRHRNWSISSTSYLPVLIVSLRYVVTSTLIRLSIRSRDLKKKPRDTYLSFSICHDLVLFQLIGSFDFDWFTFFFCIYTHTHTEIPSNENQDSWRLLLLHLWSTGGATWPCRFMCVHGLSHDRCHQVSLNDGRVDQGINPLLRYRSSPFQDTFPLLVKACIRVSNPSRPCTLAQHTSRLLL